MATLYLTCIDCNNEFYQKDDEQEFYKTKGFVTPRRCFRCRKARKEARDGQDATPTSKKPDEDTAVPTKPFSKVWED